MPNLKFSQFDTETTTTSVTGIVGYNTTANKNIQITPANFINTTGGPYLPLAGGTMTGSTFHGDDVYSYWGTGNDLRIYNNSTNGSNIWNTVGHLTIQNTANDQDIRFFNDDGSGSNAEYFRLNGGIASSGTVYTQWPDNSRIALGSDSSQGDLNIYHNSTDSFVNNFTGDLYIKNNADDKDILFQSDDGSGGTTTYVQIDGTNVRTKFSKNTIHSDNIKANFGNGSDLQIYHDGSNSYIQDTGTGTLNIQGSTQVLIGGTNGQVGIQYVETAGVGLRHNNVTKLLTTSAGVDITDRLDIDSTGNAEISLQRASGAGILIQAQSAAGVVGVQTNDRLDFKTNGATRMSISNTGDVGIGTTSPGAKLDVLGSGLATLFRVSNTTADATTKYGSFTGRHYTNSEENITGMLLTSSSSATGGTLSIGGGISAANAVNNIILYTAANNTTLIGTERMRINQLGNVGIGTTSPGAVLQVGEATGITGALSAKAKIVVDAANTTDINNVLNLISKYNGSPSAAAGSGPALLFSGGIADAQTRTYAKIVGKYSASNMGGLAFHTQDTADIITEKMTILPSSGNVGIGTTSPSRKLEVSGVGSSASTYIRILGDTSQEAILELHADNDAAGDRWRIAASNSAKLQFRSNGSNVLSITSAGDVGIGTTSPAYKLAVYGSSTDSEIVASFGSANDVNEYTAIGLSGFIAGNDATKAGLALERTASFGVGKLHFLNNSTIDDSNMTLSDSRMVIDDNGNVGIGTTSPASKLDVVGRITLNDSQDNVLIGTSAGAAVTTGIQNTLIGALSGDAITTGGNNVALGYGALSTEDAHSFNVAIGSYSLYNQNADANAYNTAVGYNTGFAITTGIQNTLIGALSGDAITTGQDNVAMGYATLSGNVEGSRNVAIGRAALLIASTAGSVYNTAIGYNAGNGITTGVQNTILGGLAGGSLTTGQNNIIIGYNSVASAVDVDNEITLGNSSIATLRCQVTSITALSDERDKTSIEDLPYGLDFVNSLQPKKFVWDHRAETRVETDEEGNETQVEFYSSNKGKKDIGFIAQELQSVDNEFTQLVYNSNPEKLEATYGRLIPVLVKAIQDLSAKVTALENA